jgi:hypothetical protein
MQEETNQLLQFFYAYARQGHSTDAHEDKKQDGKYPRAGKMSLLTLHSINLWSCLPSSVFAWGHARSKLGEVFDTRLPNRFALQEFSYQIIAQHDFESHGISKTHQISFSEDISK